MAELVRGGFSLMPILVQRKLFQTGDSLAITLPKAWLDYSGLKAGDIVEIVGNDILTIRAKPEEKNIDLYKDLTN